VPRRGSGRAQGRQRGEQERRQHRRHDAPEQQRIAVVQRARRRPRGGAARHAGLQLDELLRVLGLHRGLEGAAAAACAWDTEEIPRLARASEAAAIEANRLLRKHL
jgi:hypothetical protein